MRCYLNLMTLEDLPAWSAGPRAGADLHETFDRIREAGYDGVQFAAPASAESLAACRRAGLGMAGQGRVNHPSDAFMWASRLRDEGQECATFHVGWGLEDDDEAGRLLEAVLEAQERTSLPLYVETHRATILQDVWRTVQFVKRYPELRLNGDFSHWYTGLEMVYGGFEEKLKFITPVVEHVGFMHARIGNPGCIQVDIGDGDVFQRPYVGHFRQVWSAVFRSFLCRAVPGDYFLFVPELLSSRIFYAREVRRELASEEECDRWEQSLVLKRIGEECFHDLAADERDGR
jgi:hypothetical protein